MSDLLPDNPPTPENGYAVDSAMEMTAALWNHILSSIHERLAAREELEADFEALIAEGTSAALTMVQENVAPQLAALQDSIAASQAAIEEMMSGTAPNAANAEKLGNQLPGYYLAPANFSVSPTVKSMLAAADAVGVHDVIGTGALLSAKADWAALTNAGLATAAILISNANDAPLGSFAYFQNTEAESVAANFPALGGTSTNPRHWNIVTFGRLGRTTQIAQEVFGVGSFKGRTFRRQKHDTTWGAWLEFATTDKVLALAGGTVTGNLRLDAGIGIARDAPLVGGLYFHRPNGNPFIVFSGDALGTGTPVDLAQIRAEQGSNALRLVTGAGLLDLINFNLTTRLGTVAGDPTAPLGIATKQYADQRGPKAWVNFNGTGTVAIRAAHNVSSITDLGAGTYQVNFASPMPNANYCALAQSVTQGTGVQLQYQATMNDYQTTSVTVRTAQSGTNSHSVVDNEIVCVAIFGG